jgi:ubiquinone/menaquinone biosynthesis C-methylase UbiE
LRLLDVGCGAGGELLRWLSYGCLPANCAGIDLLPERIAQARLCLPTATDLRQGDASQLPYPNTEFDIVTQLTVFTSILDKELRHAIAAEMLRVLKPKGIIIWYDFWLNPTNPQTCGIRPTEIRKLFPGCQYEFHRITLAPPITRRLAPISWLLCHLLEQIKLLNSHYLVAIRKPDRELGS